MKSFFPLTYLNHAITDSKLLTASQTLQLQNAKHRSKDPIP